MESAGGLKDQVRLIIAIRVKLLSERSRNEHPEAIGIQPRTK